MRRLPPLALLVALTGLLVAFPGAGASSAAVGCPPFDVNSAVRAAAIFDGRVAGQPTLDRALGAVVYPVRVQTSLKGSATGAVTVAVIGGRCSPGRTLKPNEDYYFFVNPSDRRTDWVAPGTAPTVVPYSEQTTQQLHAILDRQAPRAAPVTFEPPLAGEPSSFTRVAAPGAALLIVGVLGYAVVRRLGRRPF